VPSARAIKRRAIRVSGKIEALLARMDGFDPEVAADSHTITIADMQAILRSAAADDFVEEDHPRGQPANKGQFVAKGEATEGMTFGHAGSLYSAHINGEYAGSAHLSEKHPFVSAMQVEDKHAGKGVAHALHDHIESQIGRKLVPSPLDTSDRHGEVWKRRLAGMDPKQADALIKESRKIGRSYGVKQTDIDARLQPLRDVVKGRAHPGHGYSPSAFVDGQGRIHTKDVDDAVRALYERRDVVLAQPREVSTLIEKLGKVTAEMVKLGKQAPVFDLCHVSVAKTNLFCAESKGIPRIEMPQLDKDQTKQFQHYLLSKGYTISKEKELADHLRATQNELNGAKVAANALRLQQHPDKKLPRLIVSRDNYILDGHHRWAAVIGNDAASGKLTQHMKISRVNIGITDLLKEAEQFGAGHAPVDVQASPEPQPQARHDSERRVRFLETAADAWDESSHPRVPKGESGGGQFTSGGGGGAPTLRDTFAKWGFDVSEPEAGMARAEGPHHQIDYNKTTDEWTVREAGGGEEIATGTGSKDLMSFFAKEGDEYSERAKAVAEKLPEHELNVVTTDVGGSEWNQYTATKLETDYQQARPELDTLADKIVSSAEWEANSRRPNNPAPAKKAKHEPDKAEYEEWSMLPDHIQEKAEQEWKKSSYDDFLQSEKDNWYDNGGAADDAGSQIVNDFNDGTETDWADETMQDVINDWDDEHPDQPLPYNTPQLLEALKAAEYKTGYGSKQDPEWEWDDSKLQKPIGLAYDPEKQGQLPGMEQTDLSGHLTQDMRDELEKALTKAFDKEQDKVSGQIDPPDYLGESVEEFQDEMWGQYSDKEKFQKAQENLDSDDLEYEIEPDEDEEEEEEPEPEGTEEPTTKWDFLTDDEKATAKQGWETDHEGTGESFEAMEPDEKYEASKPYVVPATAPPTDFKSAKPKAIDRPKRYDPLNETSGADYQKTQYMARQLSYDRSQQLLTERGILKVSPPKTSFAQMTDTLNDDLRLANKSTFADKGEPWRGVRYVMGTDDGHGKPLRSIGEVGRGLTESSFLISIAKDTPTVGDLAAKMLTSAKFATGSDGFINADLDMAKLKSLVSPENAMQLESYGKGNLEDMIKDQITQHIGKRFDQSAERQRELIKAADSRIWEAWKGSSTSPLGMALQVAVGDELGGRVRLPAKPDLTKFYKAPPPVTPESYFAEIAGQSPAQRSPWLYRAVEIGIINAKENILPSKLRELPSAYSGQEGRGQLAVKLANVMQLTPTPEDMATHGLGKVEFDASKLTDDEKKLMQAYGLSIGASVKKQIAQKAEIANSERKSKAEDAAKLKWAGYEPATNAKAIEWFNSGNPQWRNQLGEHYRQFIDTFDKPAVLPTNAGIIARATHLSSLPNGDLKADIDLGDPLFEGWNPEGKAFLKENKSAFEAAASVYGDILKRRIDRDNLEAANTKFSAASQFSWPSREDIIKQTDRDLSTVGGYEGLKAMLRAKWETSQYLLHKAGIHQLDLYRGMGVSGMQDEETIEVLAKGTGTGFAKMPGLNLIRSGAASTTTDRGVANGWNGKGDTKITLRFRVPRTAVISLPAYGINVHGEHEVVIGGLAYKDWDVWKGQAPSFDAVPISHHAAPPELAEAA
jgi:GNAT superfamily N-acetyltransferase